MKVERLFLYLADKAGLELLLDVLVEVAKEACFALHGGTAINLFVRDMPKQSVPLSYRNKHGAHNLAAPL